MKQIHAVGMRRSQARNVSLAVFSPSPLLKPREKTKETISR